MHSIQHDLSSAEIAAHIEALEQTGEFRVLRRLHPDRIPLPVLPFEALSAETLKILYCDTEATGLDHDTDEVFEFAAIPFTATRTGHIVSVEPSVSWLNETTKPIPDNVAELTGVTNDMVRGHRFDPAKFEQLLSGVDLIIAHFASFDRTMCEKYHPRFAEVKWGCSASQVNWKAHGHDSGKLTNLALANGFVFGSHRAANDCAAGVTVLSRELKDTGTPALAQLLHTALLDTVKLFPIGAPFEKKDILKARGYEWSDGTKGLPKTWWKEVSESEHAAEASFLQTNIFGRPFDVPAKRITPTDRFSKRA
jgi:DNA polymerase-3 subunit epsilon